MLRIYLDWNVIIQLKAQAARLSDFNDFIRHNFNRLCIPYSHAHLKDMSSGSEEFPQFLTSELEFLAELSHNNYMIYDYTSGKVEPFLVQPSKAFEGFNENNLDSMSIDAVLEHLDSESDMKFGKMIRCFISLLPNPHYMQKLPSCESGIFTEMANSITSSPSYYHLLKAVTEYNSQVYKDPVKYKSMRSETRKGLQIKPHQLSTSDQPMEKIESELRRISGNSDVGIMTALETLKIDYPEFRTWLTDFFAIYLTLDYMGYHSDKINEKNKPDNLITDIMHTFYGAHCDYYISCDKKAVAKASQVYKELKISTKATSPELFLEEVARMDFEHPTIQDLVDKVSLTLRSNECFLSEISSVELPDARGYVFKPVNAIFSYFNFLQYIQFNDHFEVHLLHVNKNCSRFIFYYEIERIVDMFVIMLGPDIYGKQEVTPDEISTLDSFERLWVIDTYLLSLIMSDVNQSVLCKIMGSNTNMT